MKRTFKVLSFVLVMIMLAALVLTGCGEEPVKKFDDNDEFLTYVLTGKTSDFSDEYDGLLANIPDLTKGYKTTGDMSVTLGKALTDLLKEEADIDLSKLGTINADVDFSMNDEIASGSVGLKVGSNSLISGDIALDMKNLSVYGMVPELNRTPFVLNFGAIVDEDQAEMIRTALDLFVSFTKEYQKMLPTGKQTSSLFSKYLALFLKDMKKTVRTEETLTVDGVSQECVGLSLEITEEMAVGGAKNVLKGFVEDAEIKEIFSNFITYADKYAKNLIGTHLPNAEGLWDDLKKEVEEILKDFDEGLAEGDFDSDETLLLKVYADNKNKLIGLEFGFDGKSLFSYHEAHDGKNVGHEIKAGTENEGFTLVGSGTEALETLALKAAGHEILSLKLENFTMNAKSVNGKVTVMLSAELSEQLTAFLNSMQFVFDFKNVTKNGGALDISLTNGTDAYVTLTVKAMAKEGINVVMPDASKAVDITKESDAAQAWLDNLDLEKFQTNLQKALPESLYNLIAEQLF